MTARRRTPSRRRSETPFAGIVAELREQGVPVAIGDLASRLLASTGPVQPSLARRVVALALEYRVGELPERLGPDELRGPAERAVAGLPIARASFVVVDLETTGLSAVDSEIVEIGAVRIEALKLGDEFEALARPARRIPARITALTGISDAMLEERPPLPEVLRDFRDWLGRGGPAPFVAHNAAFDHRFVRRALERCALPPLGVPALCTRRLARRLAPEIGRYSLDHLSAHFGISNPARHRALGDARAAARLLLELLERAQARGLSKVAELIDLQERPPARARRSAW